MSGYLDYQRMDSGVEGTTMKINAVIAHSGTNLNGVTYTPQNMYDIARDITAKTIPVVTEFKRVISSDDIIGFVINPRVERFDERYEVHVNLSLSQKDYENLIDLLNHRLPVHPVICSCADLDEHQVVTCIHLESVSFTFNADPAMPYCRLWREGDPDPLRIVDADSDESLFDQMAKLAVRGKCNICTINNEIKYVVGNA